MKPPLPEPLPKDPLPLVAAWLDEAGREVRNSTAMTLATVEHGRPAARMVICRGFDAASGRLVFYTDRESDKGRALRKQPWAALVFHWDVLERQIRVEGPVTDAPADEADAYWDGRPRDARLAATASAQSQHLASRAELLDRIAEAGRRHPDLVPRPERWGGYYVWAERIELWVGQPGRAHDRARWSRALDPDGEAFIAGPWSATRLHP